MVFILTGEYFLENKNYITPLHYALKIKNLLFCARNISIIFFIINTLLKKGGGGAVGQPNYPVRIPFLPIEVWNLKKQNHLEFFYQIGISFNLKILVTLFFSPIQ